MSRGCALGLRVVLVTLVFLAAMWGSFWAFIRYQDHRAMSLIDEASRVRVGDREASVLPLLGRYGGYKWMTERLQPKENWIDKEEYDYQIRRLSDYSYVLGVSPFGTTTGEMSRWTRTLRSARDAVPSNLRAILGMRDWGTTVQFSIRGGRVLSVSAMTLVHGRSEWLGTRWVLAEGMPRHDMQPRTYAIGASTLTMGDGGGDMIENVFTPEASPDEVEAARQFNAQCLTSIKGCDGLCNIAPHALRYLKDHPDVVWNIIPPDCR